MLKPLRFVGFEPRPDLMAHFKRMEPHLWREVGRWANRVEAVFELVHSDPEQPKVKLTLALTLPGITGEDSDIAAFKDVESPSYFRRWVRFVWEEVLGKLLEQRAEQWEKELAESQGG